MWTRISRRHHSRAGLRYGSDLTDAEWVILDPLLPPPCTCGRPRSWPMRRIVEAILYIMRAGCAWDMLPHGFPPFLTVYRWFARFADVLARIADHPAQRFDKPLPWHWAAAKASGVNQAA